MADPPWLPPIPSDLRVKREGNLIRFKTNTFSFSVPASRWAEIDEAVRSQFDDADLRHRDERAP